MVSGEKILRAKAAARYLGLSNSTLSKLRMSGSGPAYVKASPRMVLYLQRDLDAWLLARRIGGSPLPA